MVRERFEESFERMREQSNRLADVERTTENFDEIVDERVELDRLRHEVTDARKDIVSRFEPPAPDVVDRARGPQHTKLIGKIGAAISVALLVVILGLAFWLVRSVKAGFPVTLDNVVESVDDDCVWRVEAIVRNDSQTQVSIQNVDVVLNNTFARGRPGFFPTIPAGESAPIAIEWQLGSRDGCPSVDAINHNNVRLFLDNNLTVSRGL